jgi:hypothetical protein
MQSHKSAMIFSVDTQYNEYTKLYNFLINTAVFVTLFYFHPSLMFSGKAKAQTL